MEAELVRHLELLLAAYREKVDRAGSTIGRFCVGDGDFYARLRSGNGFNVRTYDRAVSWFAQNWPSDALWPDDVPRPAETGNAVASAEAAE